MGSYRFVTLRLLCVMLGFVSTVWSQAVSDQTPQPSLRPRTISGVVVNTITNRPIPHALVEAGQHAMLTDGEGRFEFRDLTDNNALSAAKPGYFPENAGAMPPAPDKAGFLELRLVPEAVVSGRVTDESGAPLQGVPVLLRMLAVSNGLKHWQQSGGTTTNAEGEFRIAGLQPGEYALQTAFKIEGPPEGEAAAGYAPAEYPAVGVSGTGALQLRAGDRLEADMSTRMERLYPVSGTLNGLSADSALSFTVRTAGGAEVNTALQQDTHTRQFRVLLPSGSFELRAQAYVMPQLIHAGMAQSNLAGQRRAANRAPLQRMATQSVTVADGPVSGVGMTLEPMAEVPIDLAEEKTAQSQTNDMTAVQFNFILLPAEADAAPMPYLAENMDDHADPAQGLRPGTPLLIRNVPPGHYILQAQGQPPWYLASAICGGTDLTRESFVITGSAAGCTMRVVLRNDGASLQILASNEERPAPAFVYLLPLDNMTRDVQMFSTGTDGKVTLDAVAPGRYLLLATRQMVQPAFRNAEDLRHYEAQGKRIELSPGETTKVQLDVITEEP